MPKKPQSTASLSGSGDLSPNQKFTIKRYWRSQIKLADYNPRLMTSEAETALRQSLKRFGLLEPLIINGLSLTLVGGHQRIKQLDILNDYPAKDYQLDLAEVELTPQAEVEANMALNNPNLQGEFDFNAIAKMQDIDYANAGFNKVDQEYFASLVFEDQIENTDAESIIDTFEAMKAQTKAVKEATQPDDYLERKAAVAAIKQSTSNKVKEATQYLTILLPNTSAKNKLLDHFGKPPLTEYLMAADVFDALGINFDAGSDEATTEFETPGENGTDEA